MGRWNRRWIPRRRYNSKKYQDYDYEEPPPSPPSPHHSQSNPPAIQDTGTSWEIDFCKSVRVPFQKVVTAKKYMYCHENVVKWDDSAGEEAFHNAKRRYWEKINGRACATLLPDQNIYIDEIDWNPNIDPELISALDREYFNPDEAESNDKLEIAVKVVGNLDPGCDPDNGKSPWERGHSQRVKTLKGALPSWGQYDKSINVKNVSNPWEQNCSTVIESLENNTWKKCADESSGWKRELKYNKQSNDAYITSDSSWYHDFRDVGYVGEKGRRQDDRTRAWKQWNISGYEPQRSDNTVHTWQNNFASTGAPWNKGWKNWEEKQPNNNEFGGPSQSGCRKREGSFQQRSRYNASGFHGDDHGTAYQWQKEKLQKTLHFYV